jgi:hypothetical protein
MCKFRRGFNKNIIIFVGKQLKEKMKGILFY